MLKNLKTKGLLDFVGLVVTGFILYIFASPVEAYGAVRSETKIESTLVRKSSQVERQIHMIYSIYDPKYLRILDKPNWREETKRYLVGMWDLVKDDPNPSFLIGLTEEGTAAAKDGVPPEVIIGIAKICEENGVNFYLQLSGPTPPMLTIKTAEEIVQVAPNTLQGFYISEALNSGHGWHYLNVLIDFRNLCKKYNRKLVWAEHSRDGPRGFGWFGFALVNPKEWAAMFDPLYADVIVPLHETNDPRVEALNMGTCLGMWLGGLSEEWGFSVQDWYWHDAWGEPIETCPPDIIFRTCMMAASLGCTYFQFEHMQMIWEWGTWRLAPIYLM